MRENFWRQGQSLVRVLCCDVCNHTLVLLQCLFAMSGCSLLLQSVGVSLECVGVSLVRIQEKVIGPRSYTSFSKDKDESL
mmetsp:Transcript_79974/g.117156  ORF Transcript_79974/g.117156 Transcript_79974/m.117156 type:complete len:80 (-) Transcript_79974:66-305(-)